MSEIRIKAFEKIESRFGEINELHDILEALQNEYSPKIDDLAYDYEYLSNMHCGYYSQEVIEKKISHINNTIEDYQTEIEEAEENLTELFNEALAEVGILNFSSSPDNYCLDIESLQDEIFIQIKNNSISIKNNLYKELMEKLPDNFL